MWKNIFKLVAASVLSYQVKNMMTDRVAPQVRQYVAQTGSHLSLNLARDWRRIIASIVAAIIAVVTLIMASVAGVIGFILWAMNQPHREYLFAGAFLVPLLVALLAVWYVKRQWKNHALLSDTRLQLQQQWRQFTQNFK